jgi:hypothetical protein
MVTRVYVRDSLAARYEGSKHMQIGDPIRTIIVDPLELPVDEQTADPNPDPIPSPETEPEQVPATR